MHINNQVIAADEEPEVVSGPPKRTRYGRSVKKPVRYEPDEKVEDDFSECEYDNDVDLDDCEESIMLEESDDESASEEDDSDADENGNLKEFVAYSDTEVEDESIKEEDEEEDFTDTEDSDYSDSE